MYNLSKTFVAAKENTVTDNIKEQRLVTSDGLLTRASEAVPFGARARRIVVTSRAAPGNVTEVTVMIGMTGKLVWRSDDPAMSVTEDGMAWVGGRWMFVDTTTWHTIVFEAGKHDTPSVSTTVAKTSLDAATEQLRTLMNHWLKIRPSITIEVCDTVRDAMWQKFTGAAAWKAIKMQNAVNQGVDFE